MDWSRPPAVAGMFYPDQEGSLRSVVEGLLAVAAKANNDFDAGQAPDSGSSRRPKALIAPHAGYVYSGPVAASVYVRVASLRGSVRRVVLLGPGHRYPVRGLAASSAIFFDTPLGPVPVDQEGVDPEMLRTKIRTGGLVALGVEQTMRDAYRAFVTDYSEEWTAMFQRLVREENLPTVVHCTAGKDRTGYASALVLLAFTYVADPAHRSVALRLGAAVAAGAATFVV